jgi:glycolate oxidase FAD binding subunit
MTITVQAGITVAKLREVTRAEGLDLPIDVPDPDLATLGGAIACNVSGPRRYGYGTFRDYVLGITTVNDRGEAVSAGGRVVKNVAGYDLMKLHTGALGTLGVIAQVTLRLRPMPEAWASFTGGFRGEGLADVLDTIHRSETRPMMVGFRISAGDRPDSTGRMTAVVVVFEGGADAVAWQARRIRDELSRQTFSTSDGAHGVGSMSGPPVGSSAGFVFRVGIVPSAAARFAEDTANFGGLSLSAHGGGAVIRGEIARELDVLEAHHFIRGLLQRAKAAGGNVVIERCPTEWKKSLPVWGWPLADLALQKAVKRALDPKNLFNPGRFVTDV